MEHVQVKFVTDKFSGVREQQLKHMAERSGAIVSDEARDIVIIVGGDGEFIRNVPYYHDSLILPLRGLQNHSRGVLIKHSINEIPSIINRILAKKYKIRKEPMLELRCCSKRYLSASDFFVERCDIDEALRYSIKVEAEGFKLKSSAISNGFIFATPMGSSGYYAYLDVLEHKKPKHINGIGLAHILPSYVQDRLNNTDINYAIRRVLPFSSFISIRMLRPQKAYLHGIPEPGTLALKPYSKLYIKKAKEILSIIDI